MSASFKPDPLPAFIKTLYREPGLTRRSEVSLRRRSNKHDVFKISRFSNLSSSGDLKTKNLSSNKTNRAIRISSELSLQEKILSDIGQSKATQRTELKNDPSPLLDRQMDRIKAKLRSGLPVSNKTIADVGHI